MPAVPSDDVFEVIVHRNLVDSIRRVTRTPDIRIPESPLEVSSELARNFQANGCIDGRYRFDDSERARSFALLALDFVKRLLERRIERIQGLASGADYVHGDGSTPG